MDRTLQNGSVPVKRTDKSKQTKRKTMSFLGRMSILHVHNFLVLSATTSTISQTHSRNGSSLSVDCEYKICRHTTHIHAHHTYTNTTHTCTPNTHAHAHIEHTTKKLMTDQCWHETGTFEKQYQGSPFLLQACKSPRAHSFVHLFVAWFGRELR